MLGTPHGIVGSMRKLAITNGLVKSAQQAIQMPPILRLTPVKNFFNFILN